MLNRSQWAVLTSAGLSALVALSASLTALSSASAAPSGVFISPAGQRIMFIGQDADAIEAYVNAVGIQPGGVSEYTSINDQEGIFESRDHGGGRNNLSELMALYPNAAIREAIWMKGQCQNIIDNKQWGAVQDYNERMDTLIDSLTSFGRPVWMVWGYEFDGTWNDNTDPECYKGAWIRMWDRITLKNAHNRIAMVWQAAAWCDPATGQLTTEGNLRVGRTAGPWSPPGGGGSSRRGRRRTCPTIAGPRRPPAITSTPRCSPRTGTSCGRRAMTFGVWALGRGTCGCGCGRSACRSRRTRVSSGGASSTSTSPPGRRWSSGPAMAMSVPAWSSCRTTRFISDSSPPGGRGRPFAW